MGLRTDQHDRRKANRSCCVDLAIWHGTTTSSVVGQEHRSPALPNSLQQADDFTKTLPG
jgi:hypothetical protein